MLALPLFIILSALLLPINIPLLEGVFSLLIVASVTAIGGGPFWGSSRISYLVIILFWLVLGYLFCGRRDRLTIQSCGGFVVFIVFYCILYSLVMRWPEFYPSGERLRDYSILWSVADNPRSPREPWMVGYPLYYYAWWYRVAAMLGVILKIPTYDLYHIMEVFPLAVLVGAVWSLVYIGIVNSLVWATTLALIVCLGTNVSGIVLGFTQDQNWWGPSRVVKGAINEYPAWSYLLGDVHPHYLNLAFIPIVTLILIRFLKSRLAYVDITLYIIGLSLFSFSWLVGANTWEVPMWAGTLLSIATIIIVAMLNAAKLELNSDKRIKSNYPKSALFLIVTALLSMVILYFREQIKAGNVPISLVAPPIPRTTLVEGWLHFGIPLLLIAFFIPLRFIHFKERLLAYLFVGLSLIFNEFYPVLFVILIIYTFATINRTFSFQGIPSLIIEASGIAAIVLILLAELVFLNDSYGGESERMNTIFKVYSFTWTPLYLFSFLITFEAINPLLHNLQISKFPRWIKIVPIFMLLFVTLQGTLWIAFGKGLRSSEPSWFADREGLNLVESQYQGSKEIIRFLRGLDKAVVLEAQYGAYNWGAHIATLSEQLSFLGWRNHVELLTQDYQEANRREEVTKEIYSSDKCQESLNLARKNGITYLVLGPLEAQKYQVNWNNFSCFKLLKEQGEYRLVSSL